MLMLLLRLAARSRSPRVPPSFVSRRSAALPEDRRSLPGQGLLLVPATLAPAPCAWTRMGSLRSSGDPSCASAAFQDPGRTDVSSPLSVTSMLPPLSERRGLRHCRISGLTRSFSTCCHTLHARRCRRRARLASGWLAFTGREFEPSGSLRKVSVRLPIILLSCSPDAIRLSPRAVIGPGARFLDFLFTGAPAPTAQPRRMRWSCCIGDVAVLTFTKRRWWRGQLPRPEVQE